MQHRIILDVTTDEPGDMIDHIRDRAPCVNTPTRIDEISVYSKQHRIILDVTTDEPEDMIDRIRDGAPYMNTPTRVDEISVYSKEDAAA